MDIDIEASGSSHTEIQARGVALSRPVRQAVAARNREYRRLFPGFVRNVTVRLFAVADASVGLDKGCLVCAALAPGGEVVVGSDINGDVLRAVHSAFRKLELGTRAQLVRVGRRTAAPRASVRQSPGLALAT